MCFFTLHFTCTSCAILRELTSKLYSFLCFITLVLCLFACLSHLKSFKIAFAHYLFFYSIVSICVLSFSLRDFKHDAFFVLFHFWTSCHQIVFTETSLFKLSTCNLLIRTHTQIESKKKSQTQREKRKSNEKKNQNALVCAGKSFVGCVQSINSVSFSDEINTKYDDKTEQEKKPMNRMESRAQKREWISVDSFHSNGAKTPAWLYQQTNKQKINKEIPESKCTARRTYIKIEKICVFVCVD